MALDNRGTLPLRIAIYSGGIITLALGISLSRQAGLGISTLVTLPAVLADINPHGSHDMGWWVGAIFILYVAAQAIILRGDFKPIQLLQVPISLLYGSLVNHWNVVTSSIPTPNYPTRVSLTILGVFAMAVGIATYLATDLIPLSSEGIVIAISERFGKSFPRVKQGFDLTLVLLAILTSIIGLGEIRYVREGTAISALLLGPLVDIVGRIIEPAVHNLCSDGRATG